ncbi:MAG: ABC transporter permease subunit [Tissierellia bacterium]|nr:ABC transporter permease subunit [Tissierellia bacterium]
MESKKNTLKEKPKKTSKFKKNLPLILFCIPGMIWFILLSYLPMFGALIAFKDYRVFSKNFFVNLFKSDWVGFRNFEFFFKSNDAWTIVRNTIAYNAVFIVLNIVVGMFVAIALNELINRKSAKAYQTSMFLPYFLSWVVISYAIFAFLSPDKGILNRILQSIGAEKINWYSNTKWWPLILILINTWKNLGYNTVIYLSALSGIDKTYYEAASMDGATKWQQIKYITIPMLKPVITVIFIMALANIFRADFGLFYQVPKNSGPLYPVTDVMDTYVFRTLTRTGDIGLSSAVSILQSAVGAVLIILANKLVKRVDRERSLF